jgi:hypothetical protein
MAKKQNKIEMPKWSLSDAGCIGLLDRPSRKRMIASCRRLLPYIRKYRCSLGEMILEIGPFFDPLVTPARFPHKTLFYLDKEAHVLKYLKNKRMRNTHLIAHDLNRIYGNNYPEFKGKLLKALKRANSNSDHFDSIVISQVFNYIDYKRFLFRIKKFLKRGGMMFFNNVTNCGAEHLFSKKRPRSVKETIEVFMVAGYQIVEKRTLKPVWKEFKKRNQLILIAKRP